MNDPCGLVVCVLSITVAYRVESATVRDQNATDLSSCDCKLYNETLRQNHTNTTTESEQSLWKENGDNKLTRIFSTTTRPSKRTTTMYTTLFTRATTVTPIYLSKVSSLMFLSSSTTEGVSEESKELKRFVTSSSSSKPTSKTSTTTAMTTSTTTTTTTAMTTSTTTPITSSALSSTTPSSYTLGTFSSSPSTTPSTSTSLHSKITRQIFVSSPFSLSSRTFSSTSERPTRGYTSSTVVTRWMTTTPSTTSSTMFKQNRRKNNDDDDTMSSSSGDQRTLSTECWEYCRKVGEESTGASSSKNNNNTQGAHKEYIIDEVPMYIGLTMTVTAYYTPDLADQTSARYKSTVTEFSQILESLYLPTPGFSGVDIQGLRKGSIVCDYAVNIRLKGNGSVLDTVLKSIKEVQWDHVKLSQQLGNVDIPSTKAMQAQQLETASRQIANICAIIGKECTKQNKLCINDQTKGFAKCVQPCDSVQKQALTTSCPDGHCYIHDESQTPTCSCGNGVTCETVEPVIGLPATYVFSVIGVGVAILMVTLCYVTIHFFTRKRTRGPHTRADGNPHQKSRKDIHIFVVEKVLQSNFKLKI